MDTWERRNATATTRGGAHGYYRLNDIRACALGGRWSGKQVDRESVNRDGMHATRECEKNTSVDR